MDFTRLHYCPKNIIVIKFQIDDAMTPNTMTDQKLCIFRQAF